MNNNIKKMFPNIGNIFGNTSNAKSNANTTSNKPLTTSTPSKKNNKVIDLSKNSANSSSATLVGGLFGLFGSLNFPQIVFFVVTIGIILLIIWSSMGTFSAPAGANDFLIKEPIEITDAISWTDPILGKSTPFIPSIRFPIDNKGVATHSFFLYIYDASYQKAAKFYDISNGEFPILVHGNKPLMSQYGAVQNVDHVQPAITIIPYESILKFYTSNNQTSPPSITLSNVNYEQWIFLTLVLNNTNMELYVNGLLLDTKFLFGVVQLHKYNTYLGQAPAQIACYNYFNRVLTPDEIMGLYKNNLATINFNKFIPNPETRITPSCPSIPTEKDIKKDASDISKQIRSYF